MDYKKIIPNREKRLAIVHLFSFIPDKTMIRLQYRIKTGRKLNLKNPERFTEKLQWYKLNYKDLLMVQCVDKYDVREYVKSKGLEDILNRCYGVYDSVDQINWDNLPKQFVMKDTLGGGGNAIIIVKDKEKESIENLKEKASCWIKNKSHKRDGGREWPYYSGKKHRIMIEKYIESNAEEGGLIDYKFFCFNGEPHYMYVIADRKIGDKARLGIFDADFNKLDVVGVDKKPLKRTVTKPDNFEELKTIAGILSEDFPEARIDLYDVKGSVLFGEITFWDASGYMRFQPDSFDYKMGESFVLPVPRHNI